MNMDEAGPSSHLIQFITEFDHTEKTPDDMQALLPIWKDTLLLDSRSLTGTQLELLHQFIKLCEDYSSGSGDFTLLKLKTEEVRLAFSL